MLLVLPMLPMLPMLLSSTAEVYKTLSLAHYRICVLVPPTYTPVLSIKKRRLRRPPTYTPHTNWF